MIGATNQSRPDWMNQRAAQLHRAALSQALQRISATPRSPHKSPSPADLNVSSNLNATIAALNAESAAHQQSIDLSAAADAALEKIAGVVSDLNGFDFDDHTVVDPLLDRIDELAAATAGGRKLLDGSLRLSAGRDTFSVNAISTAHLGTQKIDGRRYDLKDLRAGGALSGQPALTADVIAGATDELVAVRVNLHHFTSAILRPRLIDVAARRAHLLTAAAVGDSLGNDLGGTLDIRA
jgi:flagellin-like hook-associated protein FlgL